MTSKYSIAKDVISACNEQAAAAAIDTASAQEALVVSLVQTLKELRGADAVRSLLQDEINNLGSGGFHEIQRR